VRSKPKQTWIYVVQKDLKAANLAEENET